jgi:hypothetical protein
MAKVTPANMQTAQVLPPTGWEASFLQSVGAPVNANSEQFLDDWYVAEHGSSGYSGGSNGGLNNAFDTALPGPGSVSMAYGPAAAVGIQEFPTWQVGAAANAKTLEQSNMAPLLQALKSGNMSVTQLEAAEGQTQWGQEPSWPSNATVPTSGTMKTGSSFNLNSWKNPGSSTGTGSGSGSGTGSSTGTSTTPSTALLTSAPWGGLLGSQIEEAVFFLLGAALVIVGLVITFKSGNEDNPSAAPMAKEASHAEEGAELAAA